MIIPISEAEVEERQPSCKGTHASAYVFSGTNERV